MNKNNKSGFDNGLIAHNPFVNKLSLILIKFLPDGFPNMMVGGAADGFLDQYIPLTFGQFLVDTCKTISIEQFKEKTENGTYQISISDDAYDNSTKHLDKPFTAFRQNPDHKVTKEAKDKWKHTPYVKLLFRNDALELKVNDLHIFFCKI